MSQEVLQLDVVPDDDIVIAFEFEVSCRQNGDHMGVHRTGRLRLIDLADLEPFQ